MKYKVADLSGAPLDAAVSLALGASVRIAVGPGGDLVCFARGGLSESAPREPTWKAETLFSPSQYWEDGGPIIERERIAVYYQTDGMGAPKWVAGFDLCFDPWGGSDTEGSYATFTLDHSQTGPTPLIAAMRAYVASKLGEEVELP